MDINRLDRYNKINSFIRTVLENESAWIEVSHKRDTILVHMDGKILPLPALGTGIHEVVILAVAATVVQNSIVCLEEPELHMHPTLQRKLMHYLLETNNQYFITTHSAHLIDATPVSLFHVRLKDGSTKVESIQNSKTRASVSFDLGYRASDLVQSNCIIWVEGPSDRLYIQHWIKRLDETLVEGVHYSIMFYGGALRSHLSANDPNDLEISEFISLRRLNRNTVMVMDSDVTNETDSINTTKQRLLNEFSEAGGLAWITQGREIENYIPFEDISHAIKTVHSRVATVFRAKQYQKALNASSTYSEPKLKVFDKVAIAREVVLRNPKMNKLDLIDRVTDLVNYIRSCNGLRKL